MIEETISFSETLEKIEVIDKFGASDQVGKTRERRRVTRTQ